MLRQRSDFVCMRDCGTLIRTRTMLLQIARIAAPPAAGKYPVFVGVTASKKVGGAVVRNFAKRRLRAIFRQELLMRLSGVPADSFRMLARVKLSKRTLELPSDPVVVGGSEQFGLSIVLIATRHTVDVPWQALVADFQHALGRTHCGAQAKSG
jgi:ribonuclease P protein component